MGISEDHRRAGVPVVMGVWSQLNGHLVAKVQARHRDGILHCAHRKLEEDVRVLVRVKGCGGL